MCSFCLHIQGNNSILNLSYSGIVAFVVMSMVNSTIQIVSIMFLLIIYAAIICNSFKPMKLPSFLSVLKTRRVLLLSKTTIISSSIYLLFLLFGMATADNLNKKAALLKKEKHYEKALQIMPDLARNINSYSEYWINYAAIYLKTEQYPKALYCLEKGKKWSSLPEIYAGTGFCYERLHQYPQAIQEYETLVALYPSKFLYQMLLLKIYLKNKDTSKAIDLAQKIIHMKPKIPSEKVNRYKNICMSLLRELSTQKVNNKQFSLQNNRN